MKILHVSTAKTWRGGEQQLAWLFEELQKLGVKQKIICTQNSEMHNKCIANKWQHSTSKKPHSLSLGFAKTVKKQAIKFEADLIHTHDSHAHTFGFIATVLFGNKVPLVVSRRVDFPVQNSFFSKWKYNHSIVAKIVCVSDEIKKITGQSITDKSVLEMVHSGVDTSRFTSDIITNKLRDEYRIDGDVVLIGNVAALAPHKDYFTFINTVALLIKENIKAKYFMIGEGELRAELTEYINSKNLQEHIIMTGFRKDIVEVLPCLDIFLITSETEGLGTSIVDAFASKVPVVATAAGGIPELVEHNKTGMLAPVKTPKQLAANVLQLLENKELRYQLTTNATEKLKDFSKEATAKKTLSVYQSVVS